MLHPFRTIPLTAPFFIVIVVAKGKEAKNLKRIVKVLVASALMVVLMATSVSPAFASRYDDNNDNTYNRGAGWGVDGQNNGCEGGKTETSAQNAEGWADGMCPKKDRPRY